MNRMLVFLPLLALAGCGSVGESGGDAGKADLVALVRIAPVEVGAAVASTLIYGTAEAGPGGERTLVAPAEAIVDRILAPNGTAVRAGDPILTLKPSRAGATDITKASADAASAEAAYRRALRLRADGLDSDADVETAKAARQTALAPLANLGMARGGATLRAPMAGVVQGLSVKSGDQIAAGATIASVAEAGNLRARLGIDPALAQRVRPGQSLVLSGLSGEGSATVPVTGIDPQLDPTTRLAALYARIPAGVHVGTGEAIRGSLSIAGQARGITILYAALLDDGGRSYVFVISNGVAHERDVLPGSSAGDRVQILKGLATGDRVVIEGGTALKDGMKVTEQGATR